MSHNAQSHALLRIPAVLRGMGRVAYCVLEIRREESPAGRPCTRCKIANDPPELPDGPYRVEFSRYTVQSRKIKGAWELVFIVPEKLTPRAA